VSPGNLVRIELPKRVMELNPYRTWGDCLALIVEESPRPHVHRTWTVLVNGETRDIGENHLRRIDESR
jgi:hypothetical protein